MNSKLAKQNFDYCAETASLKKNAEISLVELGGRLLKIRDEQLYEPNFQKFGDYLKEIKLSAGSASKLIAVFQVFVLQFKISPKLIVEAGGSYVVSEIVNLATDKKKALSWLNKASALTREDLRKEIIENSTGIDMRTCKHKDIEKFVLTVCKTCGYKFREYDEDKG